MNEQKSCIVVDTEKPFYLVFPIMTGWVVAIPSSLTGSYKPPVEGFSWPNFGSLSTDVLCECIADHSLARHNARNNPQDCCIFHNYA